VEEVKQVEIKRAGSQPSEKAPAEYYTGTVRIDKTAEWMEPVSEEQYRG